MNFHILQRLNQARLRKKPVVLVTFLDSNEQGLYYQDGSMEDIELNDELIASARKVLKSNKGFVVQDKQVFFQPFNPPLRMVIIGAVHITQCLVKLASLCDYQVSVVDPRQAFAATARFPETELITEWPDRALEEFKPDARTAIVTLTHDPKLDDPALAVALKSDAFYIGALGSQKTQAARQERLEQQGFSEEQRSRIHGPIGLDIRAASPAEIAVSIMAEITACLHS